MSRSLCSSPCSLYLSFTLVVTFISLLFFTFILFPFLMLLPFDQLSLIIFLSLLPVTFLSSFLCLLHLFISLAFLLLNFRSFTFLSLLALLSFPFCSYLLFLLICPYVLSISFLSLSVAITCFSPCSLLSALLFDFLSLAFMALSFLACHYLQFHFFMSSPVIACVSFPLPCFFIPFLSLYCVAVLYLSLFLFLYLLSLCSAPFFNFPYCPCVSSPFLSFLYYISFPFMLFLITSWLFSTFPSLPCFHYLPVCPYPFCSLVCVYFPSLSLISFFLHVPFLFSLCSFSHIIALVFPFLALLFFASFPFSNFIPFISVRFPFRVVLPLAFLYLYFCFPFLNLLPFDPMF